MSSQTLLSEQQPVSASVINESGSSPALLVCEHASAALPEGLAGAYPPALLKMHYACDLGAGSLVRRVSELLDAVAVVANYSRIVIDCNRRLADPTLVLTHADGEPVMANIGLAPAALQQRIDEIYAPLHATISATLVRLEQRTPLPIYIAIHSFTPALHGDSRPWHIGVMWDRDDRVAQPLIDNLSQDSSILVGKNQPYSGREVQDFSVDFHAERSGLPNVAIEVRQDELATPQGIEQWAQRLAKALSPIISGSNMKSRFAAPSAAVDFSAEQRCFSQAIEGRRD